MRRIVLTAAVTVVALLTWTGLVSAAALHGWGRAPVAPRGDTQAFAAAARAKLDKESRGNAALVLIEEGHVAATHFQSVGAPVDGTSLFQVASLSKWITAWGVMTLVEQGKLELDAPVSRYLTRWRLPESPYNDQVTLRRVLSHTAGFTDGLGYAGFPPGAPIQSLEESLTRAADASPGAAGAVRVGYKPGTDWRYSGGGYTLLQLLIEEVSGEPFNDYMRRAVLVPLGMTGSTFVLDDATRPHVAASYDSDGLEATHFTFTATAAVSLYTSTDDLTRFLQAHRPGPQGEPEGRDVLRPETLRLMRHPEGHRYGFPIWGLGLVLYAPNDTGGFVIGHDGNNAPTNTAARIDPDSGDGIIVLLTGTPLLASRVAGEWVFWNVGEVDLLTVVMEARRAFVWLIGGWLALLAAATFATISWWRRKPGS
ncbi:serine hydrolase domain-containing protein [Hyalangium versicolor]|uniref:serine hydrolase domain-containing protein n=1 Tax=Hyalangium versicolor TaxID=2861190 RepID=UPI001CCA5D86|nr:serine hydrolase domain-containing protein [Hyalangium versicolor]